VGKKEAIQEQQLQFTYAKQGQPFSVILMSAIILIHLQWDLKLCIKGKFEFWSTHISSQLVAYEMASDSAIWSHFDLASCHYYTFHPKSSRPVKMVIHHLSTSTHVENIYSGQEELNFNVVSVNQMTASWPFPEGGNQQVQLPSTPITLPMNPKSQEIFQLQSICHIIAQV